MSDTPHASPWDALLSLLGWSRTPDLDPPRYRAKAHGQVRAFDRFTDAARWATPGEIHDLVCGRHHPRWHVYTSGLVVDLRAWHWGIWDNTPRTPAEMARHNRLQDETGLPHPEAGLPGRTPLPSKPEAPEPRRLFDEADAYPRTIPL